MTLQSDASYSRVRRGHSQPRSYRALSVSLYRGQCGNRATSKLWPADKSGWILYFNIYRGIRTKARIGGTLLVAASALMKAKNFLVDWNRAHLFNPRWPPHEWVDDAWVILLGSVLGGSGLFLLRKS